MLDLIIINFYLMNDTVVQVLAATQTPGEAGKKWFQGTADAVRQFIWLFEVITHHMFLESFTYLILS